MAKDKSPAAGQSNIDTSKWEDEQVSYPPFWNPEPGKFFIAVLDGKDISDPKFHRFSFVVPPGAPVPCFTGSKERNTMEPVDVQPGETFSVSAYEGPGRVFDEYLGMPFPVMMRVEAKDKIKTQEGNDFWRFRVQVPPDIKAKLQKVRQERRMKAANGEGKARPALET